MDDPLPGTDGAQDPFAPPNEAERDCTNTIPSGGGKATDVPRVAQAIGAGVIVAGLVLIARAAGLG